ncbi:hypothetical protein BraRD5C2_52590 [Bradyrhizobium sp. RD5-C2]|nr:hypothetical protein BraRD5C2_52590 [Bradyrhizobium sp. RD5-C2]
MSAVGAACAVAAANARLREARPRETTSGRTIERAGCGWGMVGICELEDDPYPRVFTGLDAAVNGSSVPHFRKSVFERSGHRFA